MNFELPTWNVEGKKVERGRINCGGAEGERLEIGAATLMADCRTWSPELCDAIAYRISMRRSPWAMRVSG